MSCMFDIMFHIRSSHLVCLLNVSLLVITSLLPYEIILDNDCDWLILKPSSCQMKPLSMDDQTNPSEQLFMIPWIFPWAMTEIFKGLSLYLQELCLYTCLLAGQKKICCWLNVSDHPEAKINLSLKNPAVRALVRVWKFKSILKFPAHPDCIRYLGLDSVLSPTAANNLAEQQLLS